MKTIHCTLATILALSAAACGNDPSTQQSEATTPVARTSSDAAAPPGIRLEKSKVASGKGKPMALTANQSVSGIFEPKKEGNLDAFGVRIGNYRNSSDGSLSLKLCVEGACQDVSMQLAGSKDNDFLVFQFPQPVAVAKAQKVDYTLTRSADATNRVAVWAYPSRDGETGLTDPTGKVTSLVPRLAFHFSE
jgi:hypothetical protein